MSLLQAADKRLDVREDDRPVLARICWQVLLALFVVNLALGAALAVSHDKASDDALGYYALAVNLYEGQGLSRDYKSDLGMAETAPPFTVRGRFLYPFLTSVVFRLFGVSIQAANLVAALFRAALVVPLALIGAWLFSDRRVGLLAGVIYTVNPAYISLGTIAMPETTTAALYYAAVLAFVSYFRTGKRWLMALGGLAVSLAYLTRPEALLLVALGGLTIALSTRRWSDLAVLLAAPVLTTLLLQPLVFGASFSPYSTSLVTLPDWVDFYRLRPYTSTEYLAEVGGLAGAIGVRVYNTLLFLKHTFADGLWLDRTAGLVPFTFVIALVAGLFAPLHRRERVYLLVLTLFAAAQLVFTIGYPGYPRMSADFRHGQIVGPFVLILVAAGLVQLWRRGRAVGRAAVVFLAAHYALFVVVVLTVMVNDMLWVPTVRDALAEAGRWSGENLRVDAVLMTRKPAVISYAAARPAIMIPSAGYADIVDYARRHGVTHVVVTDMEQSAVPNLVQGIELFADHYRRLYTADSFYVAEVRSYDYGGRRPAVPDDDVVEAPARPRVLFEWSDLLKTERAATIDDALDVWSQWAMRARKGVWNLAKDSSPPPPMRYPIDARLGDAITLLGYDLNVSQVRPGETVELSLFWECNAPVGRDLTVFTHVLDASGFVRAQQDNAPLAGTRPTGRWEVGEIVRDRYDLRIAEDAPPGDYSIEVGMYDAKTGERLRMVDGQGREAPDRRALAGSFKVTAR